jgi:hypothetical protein
MGTKSPNTFLVSPVEPALKRSRTGAKEFSSPRSFPKTTGIKKFKVQKAKGKIEKST